MIGSYSVRPGSLKLVAGSPPSRCLITSVVRFSPVILLTPTIGWRLPLNETRNRKFLYGSPRVVVAIGPRPLSGLQPPGELLDVDDHELGGLARGGGGREGD